MPDNHQPITMNKAKNKNTYLITLYLESDRDMPDYFDETFLVEASNWEEAHDLGHAEKNRRYKDGLFELFGKSEPVQVSVRIHKEPAPETKPNSLARLTTILLASSITVTVVATPRILYNLIIGPRNPVQQQKN